jgi:hypothetical protein
MIKRDEYERPAMRRGSSISASLRGREDFDAVVLAKGPLLPRAARHDLAIDGDGETGAAMTERVDQLCHRRPVVALDRLAVEDEPHRTGSATTGANRRGSKGSATGGTAPVQRRSVTAEEVTGASRMPLRK